MVKECRILGRKQILNRLGAGPMLRKLLLSTAIVAVSTTFTFAADAVQTIDDPVPPVFDDARFDWGGLYVGGQIGYGDSDASLDFPTNAGLSGSLSGTGMTYGIFAGYNLSLGNGIIIGIEGDYTGTDITADGPIIGGGVPGEHWDVDIEWMASIRARAGVAINERTLLFATAGWVTAEIDGRIYDDLAGTVFRSGYSGRHHGWTVGGGIEYAFTNNWIARVEVRHSEFDSERYDPPGTILIDPDFSITEVRAGISYKF